MSLPSNGLDAFAEVARQKSFSLAAKKLHITQSALSQRVLNLEKEIGSTLFIRETSGVRLTELGQRLLRYCQSRELLETEFLTSLQSTASNQFSGIVRVAGYSTVTRSVALPILSELVKTHPLLQIEVKTAELRDLPELLSTGSCDFILVSQPLEKQGVENLRLGFEEYVLIEASTKSIREEVYLDHDEEDTTTFDFFRHQGRKVSSLKRSYLDEIYAIIDGVRLGLGRAVVPSHLIEGIKGISILSGYKPMKVPVYLAYYAQAYYTDLQKGVIAKLEKDAPEYL